MKNYSTRTTALSLNNSSPRDQGGKCLAAGYSAIRNRHSANENSPAQTATAIRAGLFGCLPHRAVHFDAQVEGILQETCTYVNMTLGQREKFFRLAREANWMHIPSECGTGARFALSTEDA
jgi:hypothetical protein